MIVVANGALLIVLPIGKLFLRTNIILRSTERSLPVLLEEMWLIGLCWLARTRCWVTIHEIGWDFVILVTVSDIGLPFQVRPPVCLGNFDSL